MRRLRQLPGSRGQGDQVRRRSRNLPSWCSRKWLAPIRDSRPTSPASRPGWGFRSSMC